MKRVICIICIFCALAVFAGCNKDDSIPTTQSAQEIAESKAEFSSSLAAARNVVSEEIGKSVKDKKLVMRFDDTSNYYKYEVIYFKDGLADYKLTYYLFHTERDYNDLLELKDAMFKDIQEKDKDLLLIVDKNAKQFPAPYKDCYDAAIERGLLTIIE